MGSVFLALKSEQIQDERERKDVSSECLSKNWQLSCLPLRNRWAQAKFSACTTRQGPELLILIPKNQEKFRNKNKNKEKSNSSEGTKPQREEEKTYLEKELGLGRKAAS